MIASTSRQHYLLPQRLLPFFFQSRSFVRLLYRTRWHRSRWYSRLNKGIQKCRCETPYCNIGQGRWQSHISIYEKFLWTIALRSGNAYSIWRCCKVHKKHARVLCCSFLGPIYTAGFIRLFRIESHQIFKNSILKNSIINLVRVFKNNNERYYNSHIFPNVI